MKTKTRKALMVTVVIVVFVLLIQGVYAVLVSPLQLSMVTDKRVYPMGEPAKIALILRNVLLLPAQITFYRYLFDFVVQDDKGNEIYWWGRGRLSALWPKDIFLMPSQTKTETLEWNQVDDFEVSVSAGTYKIIDSTTFFAYGGKEYRLEAETMITIE